jgi:hypothetical protein
VDEYREAELRGFLEERKEPLVAKRLTVDVRGDFDPSQAHASEDPKFCRSQIRILQRDNSEAVELRWPPSAKVTDKLVHETAEIESVSSTCAT